MTTFVEADSVAGRFDPRDGELLALPRWQVAELDDANDLLDIVRAARRRRAAADAIESQAIARLAQLRGTDDPNVHRDACRRLVVKVNPDGAELTGYRPIPGPIARDIMTRKDSILRKLLVDPGTC